MKWDQQKIVNWSVSQFGERGALERAIRMNKEVAELSSDFFDGNIVHLEIADVAIILCQVMHSLGCTVDFSVQTKTFSDSMNRNMSKLTIASSELISALVNNAVESAIISGYEIMDRLLVMSMYEGVDLTFLVDQKMDVNEKRQWAKAADGSFQHV